MSQSRSANVTEEGANTIVRFSGQVGLPKGPVSVREIEGTGEVLLSPIPSRPAAISDDIAAETEAAPLKSWQKFFDLIDTLRVPDDYMVERPMNQLPAERSIFED